MQVVGNQLVGRKMVMCGGLSVCFHTPKGKWLNY